MSSKKRKLLGLLIPAMFFHFWYWSIMAYKNLFYVFADTYPMAITMVFGSVISGMTSVGGGAVAFPVMTLVMRETPEVARDLSMSIQANGMTAAAFSILFMKVHTERNALLYSFLGAFAGVIFGLEVVDPVLTPSMKKMGFVSIFFAFAFTLFLINWNPKRKTYNNIPDLTWWKKLMIFIFGFIGGIFTSFSGSGADICMFSLLTLYFKVSEKVATPTSVVLMAATSMGGWWWRAFVTVGMPQESWDYLLALIPIVTIGAPLGALIGSHFHRLVLAALVYILNTASLISAFVIVPQTAALAGGSVAAMVGMFFVYSVIYKLGERMNAKYEATVVKKKQDTEIKVDKSNGHFQTNGLKLDRIDGADNPSYHNNEENNTKL
ncbi:putative Sulfite exporter TauE/SafE-containing protein 1 [Homarus americanus]|uniref:Putative Sulfite exporter TauE/SafE-containing protein 1 n=2 Tax=Homarus americanus TaxID=6706 RepID=A0A8J5MK25_HOMAM|nr:putative Sulfite exporter TauE/SafE-containing protein 1 [Homarus americanus]